MKLDGEKRTNKSILDELQTRRELLAQIIEIKMAFFGHACRNNRFDHCISEKKNGCPRMQYIN